MKCPLITVIVPTYNSPYIYETLRSILEQDYERIQLLVVDDGSNYFSACDIENFFCTECSSHIEEWKILVNPQNRGTVYSLNRAIEYAKGEYIFNLASDDTFFDKYVLSDWVRAFQTSGALVMTAMRAIYDATLSEKLGTAPTNKQIHYLKTLSPQELFEKIVPANFIFGCCTARSAECIRKYGKFDERYRLIEDHSMNLRLLRSGERIVFFERLVVRYRSGGTSSAGKYNIDYEKDVDMIYQNEIFPFTKYPNRARRALHQWKYDQMLGKRYQIIREKIRWKPALWMLWLWYRLHHPLRTLCRIPSKIAAHINKGAE